MNSLSVQVAPWAVSRIVREYGKPNGRPGVNKSMLKRSLTDFPDTEFTIWGGSTVTTTREARAVGYDLLEVRKPNGDLLAAIYLDGDKVNIQ